MPTTSLMPLPKQQYFTALGTPLFGGHLYTYAAGTSTPKETYTNAAGTTKQPNPIPLNVRGEPENPIFWSGNYKVELRTLLGDLVYTVDNYNTDPAGVWSSVAQVIAQLATSEGSSLLGYIAAGIGTLATTVQEKLRERVSAMDYMTSAERADVLSGTPKMDVTAAVQRAINATASGGSLIWPKGSYKVTTLTTGRIEANWYFDHAEIIAGATTMTPCLLKFSGLHCNIYGLKLNALFNLNYGCMLWWYNDADSSQHNNFFGVDIRYCKRGIIFGAFPGETSTGFAQSENTIFGLHTRGVERPLYMNHTNGVLFLSSPALSAQNDDWEAFSPGQFDNTKSFAFETYAGVLMINGGEVQNSVADVASYCAIVQGGETHINDAITEVDTPFLLSGELYINDGRLLNTQSLTDQFVIAPTANSRTKLKVAGTKILRGDGVGSFSARKLVNNAGSSDNIDISFDGTDISEWGLFIPAIAANQQSTHFSNVRWYPDGTKDPRSTVFLIDTRGADILDRNGIDTTGSSSSGFYQGLWYGSGSVWSISSDTPNSSYSGSLSCVAPGQAGWFTADSTSLVTLKATATRVKTGDKFLVECWIKYAAGTKASASLWLFDAAGVAISPTPFLEVFDEDGFVTGAWQYLRNVVTIPAGVAFVGFGGSAFESEVRFCGLKIRRADWNNQ